MWKNSEYRCHICRRLYCCMRCRLYHQINKHPTTSIKDSCDICLGNGQPILLIPDIDLHKSETQPDTKEIMSDEVTSSTDKNDQISKFISDFLDHIAVAHLPLHCVKCLQVFLTREDLSRPVNRCDGHSLDRHKALQHVKKSPNFPTPQLEPKNNSEVEANNNLKQSDDIRNKFKIEKQFSSDQAGSPITADDLSSLCQNSTGKGDPQDMQLTTSTPMARCSDRIVDGKRPNFRSPHLDSQVSDIVSPGSDIDVTPAHGSLQNTTDGQKQGILFKGSRTPGYRKNRLRVHFAATPATERGNSTKRIIKYTPKRRYITNPRFQEIRMRFESGGVVPGAPVNSLVTTQNTKDINIAKSEEPACTKSEDKIEEATQPKPVSIPLDPSTEEVQTPPLTEYCKPISSLSKSDLKVSIASTPGTFYTGIETPTASAIDTPVLNSCIGPTPCVPAGVLKSRSQFPEMLDKYQESPETTQQNSTCTDLARSSASIWATPMNLSDPFRASSMKNNDSPFDENEEGDVTLEKGDDDVDENGGKGKVNHCSGGLWGSVTGAAKNILHNIHGLVLGGGANENKSKRPRSASIGPTSTNNDIPLRALKRSKSGEASNLLATLNAEDFVQNRCLVNKFSRVKGRRPISDRFKKAKNCSEEETK